MSDSSLTTAFDDLFAKIFDRVSETANDDWCASAWDQLAAAELPWVSVPESYGGTGGTAADAYELLYLAGKHATPVPLAETGLLAGWLLTTVGLQVPREPLTVVPGNDADDVALTRRGATWVLHGRAHRVPWAGVARLVLLILSFRGADYVVVVSPGIAVIEPGENLAGEPRNSLLFESCQLDDAAVIPLPAGVDQWELRRRGAMSRAVLMAGALTRVADLTVHYAQVRHQFGRPIGRFQAVAQNLALMVEHTERARLAITISAQLAAAHGHDCATVARAKILAGESARITTALAHQVHGALGMTEEYPLGRYTRRLWSWTSEYGTDAYWAQELGRLVSEGGVEVLRPLVTSGLHAAASTGGGD